ncbi:hypothetical protein E2C06_12690 [Dankookia rubra]|uniref:DUF2066 domain-containing protein n=1 Tax=Dankookia rubra TaxID=1442381 RepID=A0A4R5QG47_9PROT|nr:hypothetical protein [Dankookia rubra]TDH62240.1 hypothetical protein E2C06_12690 [Dankookia rubra]
MPASSRGATLVLAWGLILAGPGPALAQVPPPSAGEPAAAAAEPAAASLNFTQRGVPAEASAENGVLAKEKALAAGRRAAWSKLLAEAGTSGPGLSDQQIDDMVSSIVIEEERTSPTRYSGRITVNFNPNRVRSQLGGRVPGLAPVAGGGAAAPAPAGPASNWVDAVATYRSMAEWLDLVRRLKGAGQIASVDIQAIAVDAARVRLGLRGPTETVMGDLAGLGIQLVPAVGARPGETWRVGLAGGG